jgi:hypothetical protein
VAGGLSRLVIPLVNLASTNGPDYPGIALTSTTPGVSGTGVNELFGIGPNRTMPMSWNIRFGGPLASGSVVHFRAEVFAEDLRRTRCDDSPALELDVVLQ